MFGPYTPVRRIGSGGMGEVWAATGPAGVEVAVKVLPEGTLTDPATRARFAREVAAAQRVQHPRVQSVIDSYLDVEPEAERPWLACELVEGPTLAQRIATEGPVVGPDLHALATGLADALAAVHAAGVVHRDVSPANVVLAVDGPVLVDFGIARFAEATTLTMTGTVMGTAGWLAPEMLRDQEVTSAADIWSWAAVLAFAATGRPPADGPRAEVVLRKVLDGELDLRGMPPWLDTVVRRCLVADPTQRPSAAELFLPPPAPSAAATSVIASTAVQPAAERPEPETEQPAEAEEAGEKRALTWEPWALRGGVLALGVVLGLAAPVLLVVLVGTATVLGAAGLRLWAEERAEEKILVITPGTLVLAAFLAAIAALSQAIGLLLALIVILGVIVLFFALGGDFG